MSSERPGPAVTAPIALDPTVPLPEGDVTANGALPEAVHAVEAGALDHGTDHAEATEPSPVAVAQPEPGTQQLHHLSPRRLIALVPKPLRHAMTAFVSLLIVIYFLVPALLNARKSLSLLGHISVLWLVAGIGFEAAALYAYARLTRTLTPPDGPDLWTLFRIDMSTLAASHVLPGGTAPGTSLGYRLMTSAGMTGPDAGFAMATQGIGSAVVLNVLLWLALVISIPIAGTKPGYVVVALVSVLLLAFFAGIIYLLTKGEELAARVLRAAARPIPRLQPEKVEAVVRRIGARIRLLGRDREMLRSAIAWAAANWLLDAASLWAFVAAFGNYMNPVYLFVAYGVGNVLAAIPLTPGGVGLVEAAVPAALAGFGLRHPDGVAYLAVIGWRLVNFWLPIPIGAAMYVSLRVDRQRVKHLVGREGLAQLRTIPEMTSPVIVPVPVVAEASAAAGIGGSSEAAAAPAEPQPPIEELAGEGRPLIDPRRWAARRRASASEVSPERIATQIAASEAARRRLRNALGSRDRSPAQRPGASTPPPATEPATGTAATEPATEPGGGTPTT